MKVEIFSAESTNAMKMQPMINQFLEENRIRSNQIIKIIQTETDRYITISIFYDA